MAWDEVHDCRDLEVCTNMIDLSACGAFLDSMGFEGHVLHVAIALCKRLILFELYNHGYELKKELLH